VTSSRIGQSLREARARLGWSREALAYHSGVSWSAIAQIESGRRQDVRLRSLSALAGALGMSVDYLIGRAAPATPSLAHQVLVYSSPEEFLAATVPYVTEGLERSHATLAVTSPARIGLLRDALGDRAGQVEFADSTDWYSTPGAAMSRYGTFVTERFEAGAPWVRVLGEPVWTGRSAAEVAAWTRYESVLNLVFAASPATVLCPYDTTALPAAVVAYAQRTHPEVVRGSDGAASPAYQEPADFLIASTPSRAAQGSSRA
jgi:transcriptional regulator with XRE-family HTH domain